MAIIATSAGLIAEGDAVARPARFAYLEWGPVIAGALGAAAISLVFFTFGSAIGLSAVSPYPYSGLSAQTFFIVAALFAALVQVGSFAAGGYLAGRMRTPWANGIENERHFRDGTYGFVVWALGLLIGAAIALSGAGSVLKTAVQTTATIGAGAAAAAGPTLARQVGMAPSDMAIDLLLRPVPAAPRMATVTPATTPVPATPAPATATPAPGTPAPAAVEGATADQGSSRMDMQGSPRMEMMMHRDSREDLREPLTRVFTGSLRDGTLAAPDRTYLATVVSRQTGMTQLESEKRVDQAYEEGKKAEAQVRAAADKARKTAAIAAFLAAATLLIACAAACAGAAMGGRHRDEQTPVRLFGASRFW